MKKLITKVGTFAFLISTMFICTACPSDDDPEPGTISVNSSSLVFEAAGGSQTIQVTSNSAWNVSGIQSWITVNPTSSVAPSSDSETKSLTISVGENTEKNPRSCTLSIMTIDGKAIANVEVKQEKPKPYLLVNGLENTSLQFSSNGGINYKQTVKISSNVNWSLTGVPEWLSVSPTNGSGDLSVDIYPKTDNDSDDKERSVQLLLVSDEAKATIKVSQDSDLDKDAYVTPTNIVTLYNGIAFDYEFGKNVSYYYRGYMVESAVASMTDAEVIQVLEQNFSRFTKSDNEVAAFAGLDEGVSYMVYTVGYNKNGKRGKLTKTKFETRSLKNNEPMAWISKPTTDGAYWYWTTEKSATCYSYYMLSTEDLDFAVAPDVYQAWVIDYNIRKGYISEFVNGGNWYMQKTGSLVAVMTWGLDKNENFAGAIDWNYCVDSSSRRLQKENLNDKIDKNYPIIGKEKITIFKRR